jgi:hypothetical protein
LRSDDPLLLPEDLYHPCLSISFAISNYPLPEPVHTPYYNFKKANFLVLYQTLFHSDWNRLYNFKDVDMAVDYFYEMIYRAFSMHVPKRNKIIKSEYPNWFTRDVIQMIKQKKLCARKMTYSRYYRAKFIGLRSIIKLKIAQCYKEYILDLQSNLNLNIKHFWNYIASRQESRVKNYCFEWNNCKVTGADVSRSFADYFSSNYSSI